ncbi:helix-turn-helix transcriptional regulator [Priestia flexa]|uniref:helix-turn-helix transcriptional regulator n=1 Tax=Priestia flexa TaxID=86664 RepID=UPI003F857B06
MKCNIGKYIEESGLKRSFIANKLGITGRHLVKYINGESYPPVPKLFLLAKLLNAKVDDLYEFEE